MAVGDLEHKIGELAGQLRLLAPALENVATSLGKAREQLAANQENLKQVWIEIEALKARHEKGSKKIWDLVLAFLSAALGAGATWFFTRKP